MEATTDLLTLEQYAALVEQDERHVTELVRGVLVREPRPGDVHGTLQVTLGYHLRAWARAHGAKVTAESGYILGEDPSTLRGPDLAVVLEPRSGRGEPGGWIRGAPDVAVEILSPSDTSTAVQEKTLDYLGAGAEQVWIVDPVARSVTVFRADGSGRLLRHTDTLDGEDLLVDFSVTLEELFGGV
ncbi:MAG TPA: Uma2 family endonuclease [Longimicrobiales bacterium]|nr:Uma2 family endonuclease [Longimicrobiales bacterium]